MFFKKIIDVETLIDRVGDVRPLTIIWENGARYKIDKILRHSLSQPCRGYRRDVCRRNRERNTHDVLRENRRRQI